MRVKRLHAKFNASSINKEVLAFLRELPEERKKAIRKLIELFGCKKLDFVKK